MKNSERQKQTRVPADTKFINQMVTPKDVVATELKSLLIDSLKDIYCAENALVGALPKMAANATSAVLKTAIKEHLETTRNQVNRLEKIFDILGVKAEEKKCEAITGLLKEGESILEETVPGAIRDSGIIAVSQKIEHYDISSYGTLAAFFKTCDKNDVAKLLT